MSSLYELCVGCCTVVAYVAEPGEKSRDVEMSAMHRRHLGRMTGAAALVHRTSGQTQDPAGGGGEEVPVLVNITLFSKKYSPQRRTYSSLLLALNSVFQERLSNVTSAKRLLCNENRKTVQI